MDDWGDPWADDATKGINSQVVSQESGKTPALGTLPSWQDDAQWGDSGDAGDWGDFQDSRASEKQEEDTINTFKDDTEDLGSTPTEAHRAELWGGAQEFDEARVRSTEDSGSTKNHTSSRGNSTTSLPLAEELSYVQESVDALQTLDSATDSSSDTTVHAGAVEDNGSTRPSTTTSEATRSPSVSHETPRTSSEDDRYDTQSLSTRESEPVDTFTTNAGEATGENVEDAYERRVGRLDVATSNETDNRPQERADDNESLSAGTASDVAISTSFARPDSTTFRIDQNLLKELLPTSTTKDQFPDRQEDVLGSTSAKKAWYRLTRKETLREFNAGSADDNYIRVTWARSQVRTDVNKVVSRWMIEDRATGKASFGNRPSAMFGWDQPISKDVTNPGFFRKSSSRKPSLQVNATRTSTDSTRAKKTISPKLASPSFGWSSASAWDEPTHENDAETAEKPTIEAPPPTRNPVVAKLAGDNIRPMSADFSTPNFQFGHKKNTQSVSKLAVSDDRPSIDALMHNAAQKNLDISPMVPNDVEAGLNSQWRTSARPSDITVPPLHVDEADGSFTADIQAGADNDDDWGEMVQSPTLPPPPTAQRVPSPLTADAQQKDDVVKSILHDLPNLAYMLL